MTPLLCGRQTAEPTEPGLIRNRSIRPVRLWIIRRGDNTRAREAFNNLRQIVDELAPDAAADDGTATRRGQLLQPDVPRPR